MAAKIENLHPIMLELYKLWLKECIIEGLDILVTQTDRSMELQAAYFSQGRETLPQVNARRKIVKLAPITEKENRIVTKAAPGKSPHNERKALDFVPLADGKLAWNRIDLFDKAGAIARRITFNGYSLEWGGDFKTIKDKPHIQLKNWKNIV